MAVVVGVILCMVAAFTLALAMNVQRFALSVESEWFKGRRALTRNRLWGIGLALYGTANLFYFLGLSFAPLSLMSALFATMLVFNALLAHYVVGEKLSKPDAAGLFIILCAVATLGYCGPTESIEYSASDILDLLSETSGFGFIVATLVLLVALQGVIWKFERRYPYFGLTGEGAQAAAEDGKHHEAVPKHVALFMMVIYPSVLGLFESLVQICLKAISSMLLLSSKGTSQMGEPLFWMAVLCLCLSTAMVIMWLRKVYARFETTDGLPIEYGIVTSFSILAGLSVFQEIQFTNRAAEVAMVVAIALILTGIAVTVLFKAGANAVGAEPGAVMTPEEYALVRAASQRKKSIAAILGTRISQVRRRSRSFSSAGAAVAMPPLVDMHSEGGADRGGADRAARNKVAPTGEDATEEDATGEDGGGGGEDGGGGGSAGYAGHAEAYGAQRVGDCALDQERATQDATQDATRLATHTSGGRKGRESGEGRGSGERKGRGSGEQPTGGEEGGSTQHLMQGSTQILPSLPPIRDGAGGVGRLQLATRGASPAKWHQKVLGA
jgi:drug/metabolite transporter (DMT)-like permease